MPLLHLSISPSFSLDIPFRWLKRNYNDPEVLITETGWSDDGQLDDHDRLEYYRSHLEEVLTVVLNKECNLKAYTGFFNESFQLNSVLHTCVITNSLVHN